MMTQDWVTDLRRRDPGWGPVKVRVPGMPTFCEHGHRYDDPCRECKRGRWRSKEESTRRPIPHNERGLYWYAETRRSERKGY